MGWFFRHPKAVALRGAVALVALAVLVAGCISDNSAATTVGTLDEVSGGASVETSEVQPGDAEESERPNVPKIDCRPLITSEEVDAALGVVGQLESLLQFQEREACSTQLANNRDFYVGVEPGSPADFESGAVLAGVAGRPVSGVGDAAFWFGGEGADEGDVGVLSVRVETPLGILHFRVRLARPGVDDAVRLEAATAVALSSLSRFPGVEVERPEPVVIDFVPDPVDMSGAGYLENLLAREQAGDWTRAEGLVATLRLFAGELDPDEVLNHTELNDYAGAGVVALARHYLESGEDGETSVEIARLLDQIFPSHELLEDASGEQALTASAVGLLVSLAQPAVLSLAQEEPLSEEWCVRWYGTGSPCLVIVRSPELEARWPGQHLVARPVAEVADGWNLARIDATVDALRASVVAYAGVMEVVPPIEIILTLGTDQGRTTNVGLGDGSCTILVHPAMQGFVEDHYQQYLAKDIAYCFIRENFGSVAEWWVDGMAEFLSGAVYPEANLEHANLPFQLEDSELDLTLFERRSTNWIFFEHLLPSLGINGVLATVSELPDSMAILDRLWHPFNEALTDSSIPDIGPGLVPYDPPFEDVQISGPTEMTPTPRRFGIARGQMTVESGKKACVTYDSSGLATVSWRPGPVGLPGGGWSQDLPMELFDVTVFVATATDADVEFSMSVTKVVPDDEECEEEEDGGSLDEDDCEIDICGPSDYFFRPESG